MPHCSLDVRLWIRGGARDWTVASSIVSSSKDPVGSMLTGQRRSLGLLPVGFEISKPPNTARETAVCRKSKGIQCLSPPQHTELLHACSDLLS